MAGDQEPALQGHFFNFFSLASGAKEAVLRIDLPIEDRLRVFRDIVEIASRHAIAVLDEQMGILFLPDGRILPEEAGMAWEDIKAELDVIAAEGEFPKRLSDFKKMMTKDLIGYLSSAGFKKNRVDDRYGTVSYCRQGGGIEQIIEFGCKQVYRTFEVYVYTRVKSICVSKILERIGFPDTPVLGLSLARYGDYEERIEALVDYERFLIAFREGVLGLADRARDIPSINKIIYHNDNAKLAAYIFESPYMPAHLVIAWMMAEDKANIEHLIVQYDVLADKKWSIKGDKVLSAHERNVLFHKHWNALKDYVRNNQPPQSAFEKEASL